MSGAGDGLARDVLSAIVSWIVAGASWLLDQLGSVMASSTSVDLGASWFHQHYAVMTALAAVVAVPMLLLSAVQAVYRQSAGVLARAAFVHLPLAGLLTAVAVQLVQLSLTVTNALCTTVSQGSGSDIDQTLKTVATLLVTSGSTLPGFVLGLGALLVVLGALALWLELIVRSAAVYVAVLFLPLAMASLVWPAVSHWCRRLVETLASIVLSKFVVVAVLSLAVGALAKGAGFGTLLTAGALLLLAAFMPFTLLRLVPMIESGAALQLEGARQRLHHAASGAIPRSAAAFALRQAQTAGLSMGVPGTGTDVDPGPPGTDDGAGVGLGGGGEAEGTPGAVDGWGDGPGDTEAYRWGGGSSGSGGPGRPPGGPGGAGGGMQAMTETQGNGFWLLSPMPPDAVPGPAPMPPGDIPPWPADPEMTAAMLSVFSPDHRPGPPLVIPDSVGGMPGVKCPLVGGTIPPNRFEPGPKDDWSACDALDDLNSGRLAYGFAPGTRWVSSEPPIETPEDAELWDWAVRRDTEREMRGDGGW